MSRNLALTWQLTEVHGWGLVGVHTALHLVSEGRPPLLLERPELASLRPENRERLSVLLDGFHQISALVKKHWPHRLKLDDCTVLHALSNGMHAGPPSDIFRGERNIGVIAFEDTGFDAGVLARARAYDRLVVHSTYNKALLDEQGVPDVGCAFQGVDPDELPQLPPTGRFGDRFVIFSGGKLEFRKGQDLVLAAFRRFHERHPDALLVAAWHNPWPGTAADIAQSPWTPTAPALGGDGLLRIADWAGSHGAPAGSFVDLGFLRRTQIPAVLAECHAAIFPNRCEGATNLVAMEAMACGVPVILSANTGHLDLIREEACFPLADQAAVADPEGRRRGWGESSVEEIVEALERVHADRALARARAMRGADFVRTERTWRRFAHDFVGAVER